MKITQDVRDYAGEAEREAGWHRVRACLERQQGMDAMTAKFMEMGGQVYVDADVAKAAASAPASEWHEREEVKASNRELGMRSEGSRGMDVKDCIGARLADGGGRGTCRRRPRKAQWARTSMRAPHRLLISMFEPDTWRPPPN